MRALAETLDAFPRGGANSELRAIEVLGAPIGLAQADFLWWNG